MGGFQGSQVMCTCLCRRFALKMKKLRLKEIIYLKSMSQQMVLNLDLNLDNSFFSFFKNTFYWLCCYSCPIPPLPAHPLPSAFPHFSSCPWVVHKSSLASTFPTLFLTSPCLYCTYHLCFLFPAPFPPFFPFLIPADSPPNDLHIYDSVPVLVVCLVCFCFCFFRFSCW